MAMDVYVLDSNFSRFAVIDSYESLIWTERYYECGDFELYLAMSVELLDILKQDYYVQINESDYTMIIEEIHIETDVENGNKLKVVGRSLESILDRRIIWGKKTLKGFLQDKIFEILLENFINPTEAARTVYNFVAVLSDDQAIANVEVDTQYNGDNVYDVIMDLCKLNGVGFKITLNDTYESTTPGILGSGILGIMHIGDDGSVYPRQPWRMEFSMYFGKDHSYEQTENPYVVFSNEFENIANSNYIESRKNFKNAALVAGEWDTEDREYISVTTGDDKGLDRREVLINASDVSSESEDEDEEYMSDEEYYSKLMERGRAKLISDYSEDVTFDGDVDATRTFIYGRDFSMGDIIEMENEYGISAKVRVTELVRSQDETGYSVVPTFTSLAEEARNNKEIKDKLDQNKGEEGEE